MGPAYLRRFLRRQARLSPLTRAVVVGVVVALLATYSIGWFAQQLMNDLRALAEPRPIFAATPPARPENGLDSFQERWRVFAAARPSDHAAIEVTQNEMQLLLHAISGLARGLDVRLEKGRSLVRFAYPLREMPLVGSQLEGSYLNFIAAARVEITEGRPSVILGPVVCHGQTLTDGQHDYAQRIATSWLRTQLSPYHDVLAGVKSLQPRNGALLLQQ